jgi:hypothetical protein
MTFPDTVLDMTVEMFIDGAWVDVTDFIYGRDNLSITRGGTEGKPVERSSCRATINNRSGNFSPRNPMGTYYGKIGRNTQMRVRVTPSSNGYVDLLTGLTNLTAPDSAGLSIVGDIDVRIDLRRDNWSEQRALAGKYEATSNQRSWAFYVNADKTVRFRWSVTGSSAVLEDTSTAALTVADGDRLALRVTLDVNVSGTSHTTTFYTSDSIDGTWTQLGAPVTTAGVTSIFNSTAIQEVGTVEDLAIDGVIGRLYAFQVYEGIAGTLRGDIDFDDEEPGNAAFTDSPGNTWTPHADLSIVRPDIRFCGEVSEWPQKWDVTGTDVYTPIEASGVLRRLGQGSDPLRSVMHRAMTNAAGLVAYWPIEDENGATEIASGIGGPSMVIAGAGGLPDFGGHNEFKCSAPLPTMALTQWTGEVPGHTPTNRVQFTSLIYIPTSATSGQALWRAYCTGTLSRVDLEYVTGGDLILRVVDYNDVVLLSTTHNANIDADLVMVIATFTTSGVDIDWDLDVLTVNGTAQNFGGTITGQPLPRATHMMVNPGADLDEIVVGHLSVRTNTAWDLVELQEQLDAFSGETVGRRIERLCGEEGLVFRGIGDLDSTLAMGPQQEGELIATLRNCADTDGGILYEPRDLCGLAYRTRESMYNQTATLTLDYSAKDLSSMEPTDDDQLLRNDITVKRTEGSSYRAVDEDGPLSILEPPDGVGRYDDELILNLETDAALADRAGWALLLGTIDEARYPLLGVNLARSNFVNDADLALAAQLLDIGDLLIVENPPAWLPPDDINQIAQGFVETMSNKTHTIDVNCSPGTPWGSVGVYEDSVTRWAGAGTTAINEDLTTTETDVTATIVGGPLWTHADGDYDIVIGGERMTVTAVAGSSSPQTFTVTRSVNGVVKTHSTGAEVQLHKPSVYAI